MKKLYTYLCLAITSIVSACHLNAALNIDDMLNVASQHFNIDKTKLVQISPNDDTKALVEKIHYPIEKIAHIYKHENHIIKIAESQRDNEEFKSLQILKSQMMAKNITPSDNGLTPIFDFDFDGETYKVIAVHPTDMLIVDTSSHNVRKINFLSDDLSQIGKLNPNEKLVQIQPFAQGTKIFDILSSHIKAKQFDEAEKTEEFWGNLLCTLYENKISHGDGNSGNILFLPNKRICYFIDWSSAREQEEMELIPLILLPYALSFNAEKQLSRLGQLAQNDAPPLDWGMVQRGNNAAHILEKLRKHFNRKFFAFFDSSPVYEYLFGCEDCQLLEMRENTLEWQNRGAQSFKDLATLVDSMNSYIARHIINRQHLPCFHKDIIVQDNAIFSLEYLKESVFNSHWDTTFQLGSLFSCNPFCDTANEYNFTNAQGEIKTKFPKAFAETYPNELDYLKSVIKFSDVLLNPNSTLEQLKDNNLSCGFNELALQITAIKYFDFKIKDFENL